MAMETTKVMLGVAALALLAVACDEGGDSRPNGELHPWALEAKAEIPDTMALHAKVIARSCAPNGGVCHNTKEYPDLHTPGNFVTAVSRPCNQDLFDESETMFDGCEPDADTVELPGTGFRTRVAWLGPEEYDEVTFYYGRRIRLEEAAPESQSGGHARFLRNGQELVDLPSNLWIDAGSNEGWLMELYNLEYAKYLALIGVVGGDPNGNGVFGGESPWAEIVPGKPERSYLVGRIIGSVPGTRMPLANAPLTNPEYVAIHCWIETMDRHPSPESKIDYEHCNYAYDPVDHEIREKGPREF